MSSTTNLTPDQIVNCNLLSQRNRFLSLLSPPTRYTPISPYPNYTKSQLDMRRKVEILQYKKNSTQNGRITKSQKWAQMVNSNLSRSVICNKNPFVPSPSSACDVPGPPFVFTYDPSVPLYNYATKRDVYAKFSENVSVPWEFYLDNAAKDGTIVTSKRESILGSLSIQNIKAQFTAFLMTIPIGIYISGTVVGSVPTLIESVAITKATLNVYYYDGTPAPTPILSIPITNSLTNTNIFDLSMSFIPTVSNASFYGSQYIGDIIVPNLNLETTYGFLYDFKLNVELSMGSVVNGNITNTVYGAYMNIPPYDTSSYGCSITPQNPNVFVKYLPFSIT
jgi:hypothetical protein